MSGESPVGAPEATILVVDGVAKRFGSVTAVGGVSLAVRRGEVFALLGPNGAGKTTLVRMILGLIHPDRGTIRFQGMATGADGQPDPAAVGYLPEERGLYQDVSVLRNLVYFAVLRGMARDAAIRAAEGWLERMELLPRRHEPVKALSKGNQQKVQLVSALIHGPGFVLLDEPFSGLDPLNQQRVLGLIGELREAGTTVVLCTHQMQLAERIADRLLVLRDGKEALSGTLEAIRRRWSTGTRLILRLAGEPDPGFAAALPAGVTLTAPAPDELDLFVPKGEPLGPVLEEAGRRLRVAGVETVPVTLHDVYVETVGGDGAKPAVAEGAA